MANYFLRALPRLAWAGSNKNVYKASLLLLKLWYVAVSRKFWKRDVPFTLELWIEHTPLKLSVWDNMDVASLVELFVGREYELALSEVYTSILDIGAHTGNTSLYFSTLYPEANVVAVEASEKSFRRLQENVSGNSRIIPIHAALASNSGSATFFESTNTLGSSLIRRTATDVPVNVPACSLTDLLMKSGVERFDLIKVDIEGGEALLLKIEDLEQYAKAFIIELHTDLNKKTAEDFKDHMTAFSVKTKKMENAQRAMLYCVSNT